jgi:hypothetical protein
VREWDRSRHVKLEELGKGNEELGKGEGGREEGAVVVQGEETSNISASLGSFKIDRYFQGV